MTDLEFPAFASSRLNARRSGTLALAGAATIWGTAPVATKTALASFPPFVLAELRWLIALCLLLPLIRRAGQRPHGGRVVWVLGLCGLTLFYLFFSEGLKQTTASNATLISGATPVIVVILAVLFLRERVSVFRGLGIALSMCGVGLIVLQGGELGGSRHGDLLIVGSATAWAVYTVISRAMMPGVAVMPAIAGIALAGTVLMAPLALAEIRRGQVETPSTSAVLVLLYLAIGPSFGAYLLWSHGLRTIEASQAAVFGNLSPLIGLVAASILLGEAIGLIHLAGGALIIAGVWLASARSTSHSAATMQAKPGDAGVTRPREEST